MATPTPPDFILADWPKMRKYWLNRHTLFSRFDEGCKLDNESFFSVTPEWLAKRTADRLPAGITVIDPFCGAGGNAIQFALTGKKVIAMDLDPKKIEMAKHNASIYGVLQDIHFSVGDFFAQNKIAADVVFMSPPWGGPEYSKHPSFDLETDMPLSGMSLMRRSLEIADTVIMFLPRNSRPSQLKQMAGMCVQGKISIEYDVCPHTKRMPGLTAYMGHFSGTILPATPLQSGLRLEAVVGTQTDTGIGGKYVPPHRRTTSTAPQFNIRRRHTVSSGDIRRYMPIFRTNNL